jgi:hypothetical protein
MSEVRSFPRLFILLLASILITTCARHDRPAPFAGSPCAGGTGVDNREAPIVCVDDSGSALSVNPDPIRVYHEKRGGGPVTLQWFTKSGGNLELRWQKDACVTSTVCNGGHCTAQTRADSAGQQCKYDVMVDGHPTLDPDVIIIRCCSG